MGILNITPDSFSDGNSFLDPGRAVSHALEMDEEGADFIDIGGESTRPGAKSVSISEEIRRVIPVLKKLRGQTKKLISIDTTKAEVAQAAIIGLADTIMQEAVRRLKEADTRIVVSPATLFWGQGVQLSCTELSTVATPLQMPLGIAEISVALREVEDFR